MQHNGSTPLPLGYRLFRDRVEAQFHFDISGLLEALHEELPNGNAASGPMAATALLFMDLNRSDGRVPLWGEDVPPDSPAQLALSLTVMRLSKQILPDPAPEFASLVTSMRRLFVDLEDSFQVVGRWRADRVAEREAWEARGWPLVHSEQVDEHVDFAEALQEMSELIEELAPVYGAGEIGRPFRLVLAELEYGLRKWGGYKDSEVMELVSDGPSLSPDRHEIRIQRRRHRLRKLQPEMAQWEGKRR